MSRQQLLVPPSKLLARCRAAKRGVIAIIITIMVLELKVPHGAMFDELLPVLSVLGSYVLSFIYVGIYWNKLQYGCYPAHRRSIHLD